MAWLRIDDGFPEHRKVLALKRSQRWTWMELLAYSARQNNGGFVPKSISDVLRHVTPTFLKNAENAGLLDPVENGYKVHDWDVYNPKDPTNAVRQQRYRNARRNGEVTENVTDENVTNVTPRARASRPVPITTKPSHPPTSVEDVAGRAAGLELETVLKDMPL